MKVLQVNAGLETGGGLTHLINLLKEAKKEKQDFTLLTLAEGPVAQKARELGLKVVVLGTKNRYDLNLRHLVSFINAGQFDIVHTHGARANLYLSLISQKITAKWCITVHSDPYLDFAGRGVSGKIFTQLNLRALKKADGIFAVTKHFKNLLLKKLDLDPHKIWVIYNGIFFHEDELISPKQSHATFNLINVARAEKIKGQELLIRAIKKINNPRLRLYIAGDGNELVNLKKLTKQLALDKQVQFTGFLSQTQLSKLYLHMDLAVLSSYSESFPLVLLEASDNFIPILSSEVGDIKVMIPDDKHGLVFKTGDLDSLTKGIKTAMAMSKEELSKLAKTQKKYVKKYFSLERQLFAILQGYEELL